MASAEEYAKWIVDNQDQQGTPEFETVAKAYQVAKTQGASAQELSDPTSIERARATVGGVNRGIAGLLGLPVDTAENVVNLGKAGLGAAATALGRSDLAPELTRGTPGGSESIARLMEGAGINTRNPRPDDPASRMLNTGGMIAGGSMVPGAGIKSALAAATAGAVAGETLGSEWTGVGALAPAAASQAAAGIKNSIAARTAPTVETFKQAGTVPSVGQAMDNVFLHGLENLASKFPGGAGVMEKFIKGQQRAMGAQARTGVSTEAAGRAIESGVTGEGGFLARTKATWNQLDDAVAAKIPKGVAFQPANTVQALDDLTRPTQGAEKTTGALVNPKVAEMQKNLMADLEANGGQVPFEAMRALRSKVGSMLDESLVTGIPGGELKKVYGALSKDLEAAATQAGAGKEFARQNNYYRGRMQRIEAVLDRVIGTSKQPEDIFKSFYPTDPDQANKVRSVMRSLEPSERQVVSEAVANRMGRARPGVQDMDSSMFSSETFLTNWNKLSPGAKAQLFPDPPPRENMNKIANAASNIRTGKGIYANPSGTAGSFAAYSIYLSPLTALGLFVGGLPGGASVLASAAGSAGAANVGAKMMTSPKTVEWLARPINPSKPGEAAAHLARLGVIYNESKDTALKDDISGFIQSAQIVGILNEAGGALPRRSNPIDSAVGTDAKIIAARSMVEGMTKERAMAGDRATQRAWRLAGNKLSTEISAPGTKKATASKYNDELIRAQVNAFSP